uniref:Glycosyltransferase n=1 Tax=Centella asiatica TaxID=48106 RepID=A0A2I7M6E7_CENAS|nr:UDP-glucosyltransferase 73A21 [Centella asiatica]
MSQLHAFFFPMLAHGHMIPTLDIAKLFASRGVHATIITTPLNAPVFTKAVEKASRSGLQMSLKIIKFPKVPGLPEGCESADQITNPQLFPNFFTATMLLEEQLEQVLEEFRPDCLVADMFFPWATDVAAKFGIPRLVFHGTSFFTLCAAEQVRLNKPHENLLNDWDPFVVPNLPHEIKMTRSQLPPSERDGVQTEFTKMLSRAKESELKSYGVIVNSFYELEPDYADHYRNVLKRKAWNIGPVSLCNREVEEKAQRGKKAAIDQDECLKWLDSKNPKSVIYVCFGSVCSFPPSQLHEIALGLEASGQDFIWVVRKGKNDEEEEEEKRIPEGFEERMEGKGLFIRGWAPQVLILEHEAVGGFVTHCGWNSILESICAGVPMVTWPAFADQFYNEKLVTEILEIGIGVGCREWYMAGRGNSDVKMEEVEMAVKGIMVGEEAEERRNRAKALKEMAREAVEEGGSSYLDLDALIKDLSSHHS